MTALKDLHYQPGTLTHQTRIFPARIMTPSDVASATRGQPAEVIVTIRGRWMLCGDVARPTFEMLKAAQDGEIGFRLSAFESPSGSMYCVMTHQVRSHQHRYLLPMWDRQVLACIRGMAAGHHGFMLGCAGETNALVLRGVVPCDDFKPLLEMARCAPETAESELVTEMPLALGIFARIDAMPSYWPDFEVDTLSVSLVTPRLLLEQTEDGLH